MFRAIPRSSSGGQIVLLQHLVSSLSHSVHRWRADCSPLSTGALNGCLRRVTITDAVTIQFDLLKKNVVLLETCQGLKCNIYYYRINKLCIKLVIETSLIYRVFHSDIETKTSYEHIIVIALLTRTGGISK